MAPKTFRLHLYGRKNGDGQWTLMCLDFSLAAQADSLKEAKAKLFAQIDSYLRDAHGVDSAHASRLLRRSAPLGYWLQFYYFRFVRLLKRSNERQRGSHVALLAAA